MVVTRQTRHAGRRLILSTFSQRTFFKSFSLLVRLLKKSSGILENSMEFGKLALQRRESVCRAAASGKLPMRYQLSSQLYQTTYNLLNIFVTKATVVCISAAATRQFENASRPLSPPPSILPFVYPPFLQCQGVTQQVQCSGASISCFLTLHSHFVISHHSCHHNLLAPSFAHPSCISYTTTV